jgi:hypothetical protein
MELVCTVGDGRRHVYDAALMSAHYDPPGIEFAPASEHDHDTTHPVAECRQEVGEALAERSDAFAPLDDVTDSADGTDAENDGAEGGSDGANPTLEAGEPDSSDAEASLEERLASADYRTLQQVGGQLPNVDGGMDGDSLRGALAAADPDAVREAFAAVTDSEDTDSDTDNEDTQ